MQSHRAQRILSSEREDVAKRRLQSPMLDAVETQLQDFNDLFLSLTAADEPVTVGQFTGMMKDAIDHLEAKRRKAELRSFSKVLWKDIAPRFNLNASQTWNQFDPLVIPKAALPASFHKKLMLASAQWLDVYQERESQDNEAACVRLMDAWHVPVCGLFKGRLVDRPEMTMPATKDTACGNVEHQVYTVEGILLNVNELKVAYDAVGGRSKRDNFAQVMAELASAYKLNSTRGFNKQPPVYALLTDLREFHFISFDGLKFACTTPITVPTNSRLAFLEGMMEVTEQFFSVLLQAFIQTLAAVEARSKISTRDSAAEGIEILGKPRAKVPRPSLDKWSKALLKARQAQEILVQCNRSSVDEWEADGVKGLAALSESVKHLDIIGSETDLSPANFEEEIDKIILRRCRHLAQPQAPS